MTGTPLTARPEQLWTLCQAFDPNGLGRNWKTFVFRYCGAHNDGFGLDTKGATNLDELQYKLRTSFMIRRDKREVMTELPPKQRQIIILPDDGIQKRVESELSAVRKLVALYEESLGLAPVKTDSEVDKRFWKTVATVSGHFVDASLHLSEEFSLAFEELSKARKELALAKIPMAKEYIDNLIDAGEKVLVFCHHTEVADALRQHYPDCAFITGKIPTQKRQAQVDKFQEAASCNPLIGNLDAAGTGFTMTAAAHVVMVEFSFNPTTMEQAEDRAWREGQVMPVLAHYLVVDRSFDARNIHILEEKAENIARALDTKQLQNLEFLERMLSDRTES